MSARFRNRAEAGQLLARQLAPYARRDDVLVLALPRGGVPVAAEVARALGAPLDVFTVRKLGLPGQEELAMGAIATGGIRVLNGEVVDGLRIPDAVIEEVTARELHELHRRERAYRNDLPPPELSGRVVILVDDGIATGSTMRAAVAAVRQQGPARIIVAAPTAARATYERLQDEADEVAAVITPERFNGVGEWYDDFTQTSDAEVHALLAAAGQVRGDHN